MPVALEAVDALERAALEKPLRDLAHEPVARCSVEIGQAELDEPAPILGGGLDETQGSE
jgi:hypothetical protein